MCREMRDSGIQWIGKIPQGWKLIKYKYFATSGMGETILSERLSDDGVPVYSATQSDKVFGYLKNPNLILKRGDLVIPARGNSIGCVSIIKDEIATCTQTTIYSRIDGISREYLYYCCNGLKDNWFEFDNTAIPQITVNQVQNNIVPVPEEYEQIKIANYLDKKVSQIDDIISKQKSLIEKYKAYKQSLITETVTKGLNKNVPMKDSGIEWIGEIPSHWNINSLNQIFYQVKCKNTDLSEQNLLSLSYGKIIRKNINTNEGLLPDNFSGYNIIEANDIVLRLTDLQNDHTSLRVGLSRERGIITSAYITLRNRSMSIADYLYYYLHSFDIYKGFYGMGSGVRQGLIYDGIKYMKILIPPIEEQKEIVSFLNNKVEVIEDFISSKIKLIEKLESYKKSLIYECVTGKREVN